jgi:hypothetical protein
MRYLAVTALAFLIAPAICSAATAGGLELRRVDKGNLAAEGDKLDPASVRTFFYSRNRTGPIINPSISAMAGVGDELWIGYANQSFGVIGQQGITRLNQLTGRHSWLSPDELGTHSPVRAIYQRPGGDEVWVLFAQRPWLGPEKETIADARERELNLAGGIGIHKDGQWRFPVKLDGVPDSYDEDYWDESHMRVIFKRPLPLIQMAVAGGRIFVANRIGVYEGPGAFKSLFPDPAAVLGISPSADGKTLLILCTREFYRTHGSPIDRLRYDPATGKVAVENMKSSEYAWSLLLQPTLEDPEGDWVDTWVRLPGTDKAVGPLPEGDHRVAATPHGTWISAPGRLVRVEKGAGTSSK